MAIFGAVQLEATIPLALKSDQAKSRSLIVLIVAINSVAVVIFQPLMRAWIDRLSNATAVVVAAGAWIAAYGFGASGIWLSHITYSASVILLVSFASAFALGEILVASSMTPLIVSLTTSDMMTRATATGGSAWSLGVLIGPALGGILVSVLGSANSLVALGAGAGLAFGSSLLLSRNRK